jgi:hypothetical protein
MRTIPMPLPLGRIAIGDWLTLLIGVVAAAAGVGLIAYPLLHPAWVMVH